VRSPVILTSACRFSRSNKVEGEEELHEGREDQPGSWGGRGRKLLIGYHSKLLGQVARGRKEVTQEKKLAGGHNMGNWDFFNQTCKKN